MKYTCQTRCRNWLCGNFTTLPVAEQVFPETGDDGSSRSVHKSSPEQQVRGRGTRGTDDRRATGREQQARDQQVRSSWCRGRGVLEACQTGTVFPDIINQLRRPTSTDRYCSCSRKGNSPAISLPSRAPLRDSVFPDNRNLFRLSEKEARGEMVGNAEKTSALFLKHHGLV